MSEEKMCCPKFDPIPWENKEVVWSNKMFVTDKTVCFLHIPLNMNSMMKRVWGKVEKAGAGPDMKDWVMLSDEKSPWVAKHYLAVTKEVPDAENVKISGTFLTKVFEGPYQDAPKWHREMTKLAKEKNLDNYKIYLYYTTCPKCAKKLGKNYVVGFLKTN